jgi:hypothetical protein
VSILSTLTKNNLVYMIGAEVFGTNIPRVALTRTPQERLDVFVDEAASSVGFFGGGLLLDHLAEKLFADNFKMGGSAAKWARFGKTFGVGSVLAGLLVAVAFLRNYVTAKVNKTSQFHKIIQNPIQNAQATLYGNKATITEEPNLAHEKQKALLLVGSTFALGLLTSVASMLVAKRNIAKGVDWQVLNRIPFGKSGLGQFLEEKLLFGGKNFLTNPSNRGFLNLTHPAAFAFWVLPTYVGYFTGARSQLERNEAIIKFLNFTASFFFLPPFIEKRLLPLFKKLKPALANNPDFIADAQFLLKQGSGIASLVGSTVAYQALSRSILNKKEKTSVSEPLPPALATSNPTNTSSVINHNVHQSAFVQFTA